MRPKVLHVGGTLYWVIRTRNPDTQVLKDADSTPTVTVRKNGASVGDSVTVTKRSATTGIYDCSYNPASEIEGDEFTIEESATVTGTTTGQATYANSWEFTVIAVERGTDGANTTTPPTAADNATAVRSELGLTGSLDTAFDAIPTAAENGAAGWNRMLVDHTSTGSFGYVVGLLFGLIENVTGWRFTSKALEQSPSGSGDSVIVGPLVQTSSQRTQPSYIQTNQFDKSTLGPFRIEQANGDQYDLSEFTDWIVVVWDKDDNELGVVEYDDIDFSSSTSNAVMDQYSFAPVAGQVAVDGRHRFALRRPQGTTEQAAASGVFNVVATPRGPAA